MIKFGLSFLCLSAIRKPIVCQAHDKLFSGEAAGMCVQSEEKTVNEVKLLDICCGSLNQCLHYVLVT